MTVSSTCNCEYLACFRRCTSKERVANSKLNGAAGIADLGRFVFISRDLKTARVLNIKFVIAHLKHLNESHSRYYYDNFTIILYP